MTFLEEQKMSHLRINPSAILIKFPKGNTRSPLGTHTEDPIVQVCDIGLSFNREKDKVYQYTYHLNLLNSIDPYKEGL